ncbi:MAG TPA: hypothetical protein DCE41_06250 [Cytophagales bacterium]|nr:hypothetical protein [Cytophagales bacterium]HAA19575.1 hypothetical protein [Cytophagales bacterium]HAP58750.1 hypothetical protein [Cytophagales bacterium]
MAIKDKLLGQFNYVEKSDRIATAQKKVWVEHQWHPIGPSLTELLEKVSEFSGRTLNYQYGYLSPEVYTADFEQATLYGNSGLIKLAKGSALTESAMLPERLAKSPGFRRLVPGKIIKKSGHYASIIHLPWCQNNLFHWLYDGLARLYPLSQDTTPITLLVPEGMAPFQARLLEAVLSSLSHISVATVPKSELWQLEQYRHLSFPSQSQSAFLPHPVRDWLRQAVLQGLAIAQPETPSERIFICRERTSVRRITNEQELVAVARNYNVTPYFAEDHPYQDQVRTFTHSSLMVGGHGAGFSNALFSPEASVLEMFSKNLVKSHYALLAMGSNFSYRHLLGQPTENQDFSISATDFEASLQALTK